VKLIATELTPPEPSGHVPPVGDVDLRELSTRQLLSAAFPEREKWVTTFHRSGNLGAKVDWVLEIHQRCKTPVTAGLHDPVDAWWSPRRASQPGGRGRRGSRPPLPARGA
jgi:hypothetical protein